MKRRTFVQSSLAALGAVAASERTMTAAEEKPAEVYELRVYSLPEAKQPLLDKYLSEAFIPAAHRLGIPTVGVFGEPAEKKDAHKAYVLIVHPSAESIVGLTAKLAADKTFQKASNGYWDARAIDPAFGRIESSILAPIAGMPRLAKPDASKPRLLNLRIYESHSERAALKKIEMFNKSEMAIFRKVGLTPVFFAATVAGSAMPNLTYMLVFPGEPERAAAWKRFGGDDDWKKLKAIPEYADKEIVTTITNKILTPAAYSEI
jgi:NIPSNAP